ncbi:E3 ubiquitin-protein ligase msl-2-like isoform X2 [Drosophila miranda]|uniref:E3 ubiquitin-protein ligase msl-2-like isoform X2 n=1 Tax=Drosophila miranda TaxID=7229 RepID=UPI0007E63F14|nr:E3 ubiquitin-protein ligase msl-2-like isoform X2 [Drosophila miranda]
MSTRSGTGLTAAQTSFIVNEGFLNTEAGYTDHSLAELEQNTSPKQSYEETSSEEQHLNSSQKYISSTIKDKNKDTQMNPVNSMPSIISCVKETPQKAVKNSATTGSPRRNAGMTKEDPFKHNCRCGTSGARANPKRTCRNNRCLCYVSGKSCTNCRCFGCHNPHNSDDEDELENLAPPSLPNLQSEKKPAPTNATPTKNVNVQNTGVSAPGFDDPQGGLVLVPVSHLEQSIHPLVLVKNEHGDYQCFNIFQGNVPIDPATVGLLHIRMQSNGYHSQIPDYAYVMGP